MIKFKLSTTTIYQHNLIAPKGYIFDKDAISKSDIFDSYQLESMEVKLGDRVLRWEEDHLNLSSSVGEDFWGEYLTVENGCLVEKDVYSWLLDLQDKLIKGE